MVDLKAQYSLRAFLFNLPKAVAAHIDWDVKWFYAMKSSKQKSDQGFTRPTEGIIMIDAGGKILQLNQAAAALFHYDNAELIGQSIQVLIPAGNPLPTNNDRKEISPGCWFARKKEGAEFPAHLSISYCQQPGERLAFISVMDVSGQGTRRPNSHS
jgi:PAS domain S-box-containing protein